MITASTALLQAIEQGPGYGRELVERISDLTDGEVQLYDGSVYPALQRLADQGMIEECGMQGRSKVYQITQKGVRRAKLDRDIASKVFGHGDK